MGVVVVAGALQGSETFGQVQAAVRGKAVGWAHRGRPERYVHTSPNFPPSPNPPGKNKRGSVRAFL